MKQTFLAEFKRKDGSYDGYDFFRFGCKSLSTVLKNMRSYRKQAADRGWEFLYPYLTTDADDFVCTIYATDYECTPDRIVYQNRASEL